MRIDNVLENTGRIVELTGCLQQLVERHQRPPKAKEGKS
jgi:hypothetical protein